MSLLSRVSPIRFADAPSVQLVLPDEASLWACGTLYEYFPDRITFQTSRFRVSVEGENLALKAMSESEVLIKGTIRGVRCEDMNGPEGR